jgi:hypothetical protein
MKKLAHAVPILALALGGTTACATKNGENRVEVNGKVETLPSPSRRQGKNPRQRSTDREIDQKAAAAGQRMMHGPAVRPTRQCGRGGGQHAMDAIERASKRLVYR